MADGFDDQLALDGGDLRFNSTRHVQSGRLPILKDKIYILQHRRNGNDEQVTRVAAVTDDNRRPYLAAGQVGERNRQQDNITF